MRCGISDQGRIRGNAHQTHPMLRCSEHRATDIEHSARPTQQPKSSNSIDTAATSDRRRLQRCATRSRAFANIANARSSPKKARLFPRQSSTTYSSARCPSHPLPVVHLLLLFAERAAHAKRWLVNSQPPFALTSIFCVFASCSPPSLGETGETVL